MICPICNTPMTPLFLSYFCAKCESGETSASAPTSHRGFVLWHNRSGACESVFETRSFAEEWRVHMVLQLPVRPVLSDRAFVWQPATLPHLRVADHAHAIFLSKDEMLHAGLPSIHYTAYLETE